MSFFRPNTDFFAQIKFLWYNIVTKGVVDMIYKLTIDPRSEERIELVLHERGELADKIEELIGEKKAAPLIGYYDLDAYRLAPEEIDGVISDGDDVFALVGEKKYRLRMRLYQIEELFGDEFIKINRGCIVRVSSIVKFESSLGGSLRAVLKNGFGDYISRRELKNVKRRFGL